MKFGGTNCTSGENRILVRKPEANVSLLGTVVVLEGVKVGLIVRRQAVDWIDLAKDTYHCRTFKKIIINLQVSETLEMLSINEGFLTSEVSLFHVAI